MKKFIKRFCEAMLFFGIVILMSGLIIYPLKQVVDYGKDVWLWALPVSFSLDWALFGLFVDVTKKWLSKKL